MLKKLKGISDKQMTDEEVWWECQGYLNCLMGIELSPEIKNRFDRLVRGCDWS